MMVLFRQRKEIINFTGVALAKKLPRRRCRADERNIRAPSYQRVNCAQYLYHMCRSALVFHLLAPQYASLASRSFHSRSPVPAAVRFSPACTTSTKNPPPPPGLPHPCYSTPPKNAATLAQSAAIQGTLLPSLRRRRPSEYCGPGSFHHHRCPASKPLLSQSTPPNFPQTIPPKSRRIVATERIVCRSRPPPQHS
jgi:hypothetical protein